MPGTYATNGVIADANPSQGTGALSTGIGVGPENSGQPPIQSATSAAFVAARIGGDASEGWLGVASVTAGSGYDDGTYPLNADNDGLSGGDGEISVVVESGAITEVTVTKPGHYSSAPTVDLSDLGAGSAGAVTLEVIEDGVVHALGSDYGDGKGTRYVKATGDVNDGSAITSGWINRSGRKMVNGDYAWGVES